MKKLTDPKTGLSFDVPRWAVWLAHITFVLGWAAGVALFASAGLVGWAVLWMFTGWLPGLLLAFIAFFVAVGVTPRFQEYSDRIDTFFDRDDGALYDRYTDPGYTHITRRGSIVLDARDLRGRYGFHQGELLADWARRNDADLDLADQREALRDLVDETLLAALREDGMDVSLADDPGTDNPARVSPELANSLPDLRVLVRGVPLDEWLVSRAAG